MANELRRYNDIELMPGEAPLAETAEERRISPGSQALGARIEQQALERTALAKGRLEKSKLGLIPSESDTEKANRRQYLISQASRHGVPQNVLAQQMQVEGLQPAEPAQPAQTIETAEGIMQWNPETKAYDIRVGGVKRKPATPTVPKAQWKIIEDPKSTTGYSYQNLAIPSEIRKEAPAPKGAGAGVGGAGGFKTEKDLRGEYLNITKPFRGVRDSFARVQASAKEPSAAGDLALIFNYMKMLDPSSVVRESEFAQAAVTGAWGERMKAAGQKILEGERLSDVMRSDFTKRAKMLMKRQKAQFSQSKSEYTRLAKEYEIDPARIIVDIEDPVAKKIEIRESLARDFPDKMPQIQQAIDAGYGDEEIRSFLGGQ